MILTSVPGPIPDPTPDDNSDDEVTPVDHELGAFLDAEIDVGAHLVVVGFRDERSHVVAGVRAVPHLEVGQLSLELADDFVGR